MNKLLPIFLSTILVLLLSIAGILFFLFSQSGNHFLKTRIQDKLVSELGMPVEVNTFILEPGKVRIVMRVNKQMHVEAVSHYDLLGQSFQGIYAVSAKNFHYKDKVLRQLSVKGNFKGISEKIEIDGKGTALDAVLQYSVEILDQKPQNMLITMKGVSLSEALELSGQPPLAEGKIDLDINMPDIGKEFANGDGNIVLHKALFNVPLIEKEYDLKIPRQSYVLANIKVKLKGTLLHAVANAKGNLFNLQLDKTVIDTKSKKISSQYNMDVKEMGILTQNKLSGALKVTGDIVLEDKKLHLKGATDSMGGTILFDINNRVNIDFSNVQLSKILYLVKQPAYVKGILNGHVNIEKSIKDGRYSLKVEEGSLNTKTIEKQLGYKLPSKNNFTLQTTGDIEKKILKSNMKLKSTISDLKLSQFVYDFDKKLLTSEYDLFLPDIGVFIPENMAVKRGYLSVKGKIQKGKTLFVEGRAKGLGEKLNFTYDSKTAKLEAKGLFVEKLLSLGALPRYVKGKLSTNIDVTDIKKLNGTFSLQSDKLETQPHEMQKLLGKKLAISLAIKSTGTLKNAVAYFDTKIKTSMGKLTLSNSISDTKHKTFKSDYVLNIPALEKTYALTGQKLYGPMQLTGKIAKQKVLHVNGQTSSLGGNIKYTLIDNQLQSTIQKVSLENISTMLGHSPLVKGEANGKVSYNVKNKKGVVDIDIGNFQIKPSSTTNTIKMFIGKDPARIIYSNTKLHAALNGDITTYSLLAKGKHSTIEIKQGRLDKKANTHTAKFQFVYEKYIVTGTISGSIDKPRISVDPSSIMQSKTGEKIQKKLDKALGEDMGKAVGGFLKGLKF